MQQAIGWRDGGRQGLQNPDDLRILGLQVCM